jgi:hypothetical protein
MLMDQLAALSPMPEGVVMWKKTIRVDYCFKTASGKYAFVEHDRRAQRVSDFYTFRIPDDVAERFNEGGYTPTALFQPTGKLDPETSRPLVRLKWIRFTFPFREGQPIDPAWHLV